MTAYYFLCALPPEAAAAKAGLLLHERNRRAHATAAASGPTGHVRIVGMGPERARRACARLESSLPEGAPVVVLGVGGALVGGLEPGDVVVANTVGFADLAPGGNELEVTLSPQLLDHRSEALGAALAEALRSPIPLDATGTGDDSPPHRPRRRAHEARPVRRSNLRHRSRTVDATRSAPALRRRPRRLDTPDRELFSLSTVTGGAVGLKRLGDAAGIIAGLLDRKALASERQNPSSPLMSPTQS